MTWKEARKRMQSELQESMEESNPAMIQLLARVRKSSFFNFFDKDHKKILEPGATIGRKCLCFVLHHGMASKEWEVLSSLRL